jgi:hypothetical protein
MLRLLLTAVDCIRSWCVVLGGDLLSLFLNDAKKRGEELSDEFLRDIILSVARYTRAQLECCFTAHVPAFESFLLMPSVLVFLWLPPSVTF